MSILVGLGRGGASGLSPLTFFKEGLAASLFALVPSQCVANRQFTDISNIVHSAQSKP